MLQRCASRRQWRRIASPWRRQSASTPRTRQPRWTRPLPTGGTSIGGTSIGGRLYAAPRPSTALSGTGLCTARKPLSMLRCGYQDHLRCQQRRQSCPAIGIQRRCRPRSHDFPRRAGGAGAGDRPLAYRIGLFCVHGPFL
jgi:hypothetical protein